MKKLLVLGSNSDIAKASLLRLADYNIVALDRKSLDLNSPTTTEDIHAVLEREDPDVILHTGGIFELNDVAEFDSTFNTNVKSNWAVIKYYLDNHPKKLVRFISMGSDVYKQGRMRFILYAASRAAQHNMWQGSMEAAPPNFKIGLINTVRVNTKQVAKEPYKPGSLEPDDIAVIIENMARSMTESYIVNTEYKKENK